MCHFGYFNDHTAGTKHNKQTNGDIFLIHSLSSIRWCILLLDFKNFKIYLPFSVQFGPTLHYVFICKTQIYMPEMIISSLNIDILLFVRFANFWYITCFAPNVIPN